MRLTGKHVVITGASSGIGAQIALKVAGQGATPVMLARSEEKLTTVCENIKNVTGVDALPYKLDVSDASAVSAVFDRVLDRLGTIDVLVNNAGFGVFDLFHEADIDEAKRMLDVNVLGVMACTRKLLPHFLVRNSGHILNIASLAGKVATPKSAVYSATKHAVVGFSNALRLELAGTNIYVTTVNPGPVETHFFGIADPSGEYVKNVASFMLAPEQVAEKVAAAIGKRKREINVPFSMNVGARLYQMFPSVLDSLVGKWMNKK
ncbi:MAG TPA: SDR family oxidoreductase [Bacillales bacterium]|nr:SDR family oxidoreductase [Bacillales bacterium]